MTTHSSVLASEIPWTEEPGRLVHGVAKSRTRLSSMHSVTIIGLNCVDSHVFARSVLTVRPQGCFSESVFTFAKVKSRNVHIESFSSSSFQKL